MARAPVPKTGGVKPWEFDSPLFRGSEEDRLDKRGALSPTVNASESPWWGCLPVTQEPASSILVAGANRKEARMTAR